MTARVLVVDDEPDAEPLFRQQFRREVREGLYRLDFALSGEAALTHARWPPPAMRSSCCCWTSTCQA